MGCWVQPRILFGALLLTSATGFPEIPREGSWPRIGFQLPALGQNHRSMFSQGLHPSFKEKVSKERQMRECGEGRQTAVEAEKSILSLLTRSQGAVDDVHRQW